MKEFIHRENLALYRKALADPNTSEEQRKVLERLLADEVAKERAEAAQQPQ